MTIILREMIDQHTGCELSKADDGFYVFVYTGEFEDSKTNTRVLKYSDMNERGLSAALATYELELGYLWVAKLEEQE